MAETTSSNNGNSEVPKEQVEKQKQVQRLLWWQVVSLMTPSIDLMDLLLILQMIVYIVVCPYTKVEESFNTQSIHDLYFHPTTLSSFDHFEFPGVVPRTFVGSSIVFAYSAPIVKLLQLVLSESTVKYIALILARFTLGMFCILSQSFFRNGIVYKFREVTNKGEVSGSGYNVSKWYALLVLCQFHWMFYSSRPLPNTFAMIFVFMALGYWLRDQYSHTFGILGVPAVIFRTDLLVFIAALAIVLLFTRKVGLFQGITVGITAVIFGLVISLIVDSYFWQRVVWPEGELFYYNTVLNKSHEWGVQSKHWYFSSALPRALLGAVLLIPFGVLFHKYRQNSVLPMLTSAVLFVGLYSLLPHKELRFIFYGIPLFNLTAAIGVEQLRNKSRALMLLILLILGASFAASLGFFYVSSYNYYGADALNTLYRMEENNKEPKYVHLDVHATMNGVTRFLQYNNTWRYSKEESDILNYRNFTHVLTGRSAEELTKREASFFKIFGVASELQAFERLDRKTFKPIFTPKISIYKRKSLMKQSPQEAQIEEHLISTLVKGKENARSAPLKWCQRADRLLFTIELTGVTDHEVYITRNKRFLFRGISKGQLYQLDLSLFGRLEPEDFTITPGARYTKLTLMKSRNGFWPRLLQSEEKLAFIRIDWDNWVEGSEEPEMDNQNEEDEFAPLYMKTMRDGHGSTLTKFLPLIVRDNESREMLLDEITNFLETLAGIYCPPFLFACFVAFISTLVFALFHMTSVVEFLVKQHYATLQRLKKEEEQKTAKSLAEKKNQ